MPQSPQVLQVPPLAPPPAVAPPIAPTAASTPGPVDPLDAIDFEAFDREMSLTTIVPSAPLAPTISQPPGSTPPGSPAPSVRPSSPPSSGDRATGPSRPSRVPAVLGALVAVALGFAAMLWITRDTDDSSVSGDSGAASEDASDTTAASGSAGAATLPSTVTTTVAATTVPPPTTTEPPAASSTEPPATPPSTEPPATAPLETVPVPAGATPYTDPAGWTVLVEPTWRFEQSPNFTGWFTNTGSPAFTDNVNVVTENFAQPFTLTEYVAAALRQITVQAPDAQVTGQRRVVGTDGQEVELVTWSGTLPGLPPLVFLQAITVTSDRAYIATFTTEIDRMPALAPVVTPYLASIRPA